MISSKLLALTGALAMVSAADSQKDDVCSSFVNATSQADLDKISQCGTLDASLTISTDAGVLTLNGVQNITGDLSIIKSSDLTSFSAPSLKKVSGLLDLEGLTILDTLAMPQLTDLGGIKLITLPALEALQFNAGVANARNILISDTSLKTLEGLNLSHVDTFDINNNRNINEISIGATQIADSLSIAFNSDHVNVSLPNLKWVSNATFRYCASIDMPQLERVNSSLGFVNNTVYGLQFDNLQRVGSLTISSNRELRNASFANLSSIDGGFVVANNSHYGKIYGFPKLKTIRGAVQLEGNLTQASLPSLEEVDGGVNIDSSNVFNCSSFDEAHKNGDFHGDKYVCKGKSTTVSTSLTSLTSTDSSAADGNSASATGHSSSSKSSKSKNNAVAPMAVTGTGIMGTIFAVLLEFI